MHAGCIRGCDLPIRLCVLLILGTVPMLFAGMAASAQEACPPGFHYGPDDSGDETCQNVDTNTAVRTHVEAVSDIPYMLPWTDSSSSSPPFDYVHLLALAESIGNMIKEALDYWPEESADSILTYIRNIPPAYVIVTFVIVVLVVILAKRRPKRKHITIADWGGGEGTGRERWRRYDSLR